VSESTDEVHATEIREYPMHTIEHARASLAQVGRDFMYDKTTETEWKEIRVRLHARLDEFERAKLSEIESSQRKHSED